MKRQNGGCLKRLKFWGILKNAKPQHFREDSLEKYTFLGNPFKNSMNTKRFQIIPAIDLLDGKVVRLYQGDYAKVTVYNINPIQQAIEFSQAGANFIHIVDLDAARSGEISTRNHNAIQGILKTLQADTSIRTKLELGGGIRNAKTLAHYLGLGIHRCVIGTAAVKDPIFLKQALHEHGADKILVGVDVRAGQVRGLWLGRGNQYTS